MTPTRQEIAAEFGKVMRGARLARGMSQEKLGEALEVDRTYPSLLERGLRGPTLAMVFRVAASLNVSPASLVEQTDAALHEGHPSG